MTDNLSLIISLRWVVCGTLKCENASICENVAKYEKKMSTLSVKIDVNCDSKGQFHIFG